MNRPAALALACLTLLLAWSLLPSPTAEFTFPGRDGSGTMTYRCARLDTPAASEAQARAAHAAFAAALESAAKVQAKAMAALMATPRPSAEVAAELEHLLAVSEVTTRALHAEMQSEFGCQYRGST